MNSPAALIPPGFSESVYYRILEDALPLIFLVRPSARAEDIPNSMMAYANSKFIEGLGMSRERVLNMPFRVFLTGLFSDAEDVEHYFQILLKDESITNLRIPLKPEIGRRRYVEIKSQILKTSGGEFYVQGIFSDATEIEAMSASLDNAEQQVNLLRRELRRVGGDGDIVARSAGMRLVLSLVDRVALVDTNVLIQGETGTGKEMVAREIHRRSRPRAPFVPINCGALPEGLLESELFGHVRGAFTGATRDHLGLFRAAAGGTLFLDEIGELSPGLQAKLLRVLQNRNVRPVGSDRSYEVDARVIAATHRELKAMIREGRFREDLFYRLSVFPISIPPLRERPEDILILARHFLERNCRKNKKRIDGFDPDAIKRLMSHPWPGNIRELENAVEYAAVVSPGPQIRAEHLPILTDDPRTAPPPAGPSGSLREPILSAEREVVAESLKRAGGNRQKAAELLGVSRVTLWRKLKRLGLD